MWAEKKKENFRKPVSGGKKGANGNQCLPAWSSDYNQQSEDGEEEEKEEENSKWKIHKTKKIVECDKKNSETYQKPWQIIQKWNN